MGRLKWPGGRSDCTKSIGVTAREDLDSHERAREDFMASRGGRQLRGQWKRKGDDQASPKCANRFGIQGEGCRCAYACICMCVCVCGYFAIDF